MLKLLSFASMITIDAIHCPIPPYIILFTPRLISAHLADVHTMLHPNESLLSVLILTLALLLSMFVLTVLLVILAMVLTLLAVLPVILAMVLTLLAVLPVLLVLMLTLALFRLTGLLGLSLFGNGFGLILGLRPVLLHLLNLGDRLLHGRCLDLGRHLGLGNGLGRSDDSGLCNRLGRSDVVGLGDRLDRGDIVCLGDVFGLGPGLHDRSQGNRDGRLLLRLRLCLCLGQSVVLRARLRFVPSLVLGLRYGSGSDGDGRLLFDLGLRFGLGLHDGGWHDLGLGLVLGLRLDLCLQIGLCLVHRSRLLLDLGLGLCLVHGGRLSRLSLLLDLALDNLEA